ncbi:MAG: hypothetical protein ACXVMS_08230 [Flavisolibacter sp.]
MKHFSIWLLLLFPAVSLPAQEALEGLLQAEKNLAAYSLSHDTRTAFLRFLDCSGIVFDQGQPVNGLQWWTRKPPAPGVWGWQPRQRQ